MKVTRTCILCGMPSSVEVDEERYHEWVRGRAEGLPAATHSVQKLFPELSAGDREILISGTHNKCWDHEFGGEE